MDNGQLISGNGLLAMDNWFNPYDSIPKRKK
jgi:hypothetical protein